MNETNENIGLKEANEALGTNYATWKEVIKHKFLTEDFIRKYQNYIDWRILPIYQHLSEAFIREFQNRSEIWYHSSSHQRFSESFIREFKDRVDWTFISAFQQLSEDFIREFKDKVNWIEISRSQRLSENFIREFKDKVGWKAISRYQQLSEDFIREFKDRVDWFGILQYQLLSDEFFNEFQDRMERYVKLKNRPWNVETEDKKRAVIRTGLYECHEDYFIAYKGIQSDRCSAYFQKYKYEKGGIYETWCDCSDAENSFGFSAWTKYGAENYCNELVIRVKIRYEDVGRVVHNGGKIRSFKIEILD